MFLFGECIMFCESIIHGKSYVLTIEQYVTTILNRLG